MLLNKNKPGFVLGLEGFEIMFVAGHQLGIGCYLLEYETDWAKMIEIVLFAKMCGLGPHKRSKLWLNFVMKNSFFQETRKVYMSTSSMIFLPFSIFLSEENKSYGH